MNLVFGNDRLKFNLFKLFFGGNYNKIKTIVKFLYNFSFL